MIQLEVPALRIGTDVQAWSADLDAIDALATPGLIARTGAGTAAARTITGTTNQVNVANGDGVSGNPTLSLPQSIDTGASVTFGGLTLGTPLTVPNGGTGLASGTSGGVPFFNASNTMASSAALGATQVVLGGGAGAAPNTSASLRFDGSFLWSNLGFRTGGSLGANAAIIFPFTGNAFSVGDAAGLGLSLWSQTSGGAATGIALTGAPVTASAGTTFTNVRFGGRTFTDGTGTTGAFTDLLLADSINQSHASASGIVRGLHVNTTLTNAKNYRSIEIDPIITTVTSYAGLVFSNETSPTNVSNILTGTTTIPSGQYSIHNASTLQNVHAGRSFFGGTTTPTALIHLAAGTATASTAPAKIPAGTNNTVAEAGAIERTTDGMSLVIETGTARKQFVLSDIVLTTGRVSFNTTNGRQTDQSGFEFDGTYLKAPELQFGTHSAIGVETLTGFIPVKDTLGNTRKLAVIS